MAMAQATVSKLFSRTACLSLCTAAFVAALIYVLLENVSVGKLDVARKATNEWGTVPTGTTMRIPLTLATRSYVPLQLTRVVTTCGCTALEEDEKAALKLPIRISPAKPKPCWLAVSSEGRVGQFTTAVTFDYQVLLWRRQQSCVLQFRAVPDWFVVPTTLDLTTDAPDGVLKGDLWVFLPQDASPVPKISIDEGPDSISTLVDAIPPVEQSRYQVAVPSWVSESGLGLAYRITVTLRAPQGADKGTVIKEIKLHTTPARNTPVVIRWDRTAP